MAIRRVVVDTNVIISALRSPDGSNRQVMRACFQGQLHPVIGQSLFLEYEDVASRESLFAASPLWPSERRSLLDAFCSVCEFVKVYYLWRPNLRDEADNHVLELAVAAGAEIIVTNNIKDFANANLRFPGVRVLRPSDVLKELV